MAADGSRVSSTSQCMVPMRDGEIVEHFHESGSSSSALGSGAWPVTRYAYSGKKPRRDYEKALTD